jgi:hypothetical protein
MYTMIKCGNERWVQEGERISLASELDDSDVDGGEKKLRIVVMNHFLCGRQAERVWPRKGKGRRASPEVALD